jgi:hypothetical protein
MINIIDEIKLKIIFICHLIITLFVVITPLSNSNYLLFMHSIIIPFIIFHWVTNNNMCALTLIEKEIRKKINKNSNNSDCFTCKIIEPVYDFKNNYKSRRIFIYSTVIFLWIVSIVKLYNKYKNKQLTSFYDLFIL